MNRPHPRAAALSCLLAWGLGAAPAAAAALPANEGPGRLPVGGQHCTPAWTPISQNDVDKVVLSSARGPDGFIYLGGMEGLHRLEGGRVRNWYPDPAQEAAIPAGNVVALLRDGDSLWVGASDELAWFDPQRDRFEPVPFSPGASRGIGVLALALHGDRLLVGTAKGAFSLTRATRDDAQALPLVGAGGRLLVRAFTVFEGRLLAATSRGLQVQGPDGSFELVPLRGADDGSVRQPAIGAFVRADGKLWVGAEDGLFLVESLSPLAVRFYQHGDMAGIPRGGIRGLAVDRWGTLWMAGWGGLSRWRAGSAQAEVCRRAAAIDPEVDVPVMHVTVLESDQLLIGTSGAGMRLARLGTGVGRILTGEAAFADLPELVIFSTLVDRVGRLVLGTSQGLYREQGAGAQAFAPLAQERLGDRRVQALFEAADGALWIGTNRGLFQWRDGVLTARPMLASREDLGGTEIVFAISSLDDHLLVGTHRGMLVLDQATGEPERLFDAPPGGRTTNDAPVHSVLELGRVWHLDVVGDEVYATDSEHVYRLDVETGEVLASTVPARAQGSLAAGRRNGAVGTPSGEVFIATDNGLVRTDRHFSDFEYLSALNGFRLGSVPNIRRSTQGVVWFSSALYPMGLDPQRDHWRALSMEDGLHWTGANQGALSIAPSGAMAMANGDGLSLVPADLLSREVMPPITLRALDALDGQPITEGQVRTIGPRRRAFAIDFATPDLVEADRYAVRYSVSSARNTRNETIRLGETLWFRELQHGEYRFVATLVDATGERSAPLAFGLSVEPFWWESRHFFVFCVLAALLLTGGLFAWRYRATARRYKMVGDERRRIAQDLHDTFMQEIFAARMMSETLAEAQTNASLREQAQSVLGLLRSATGAVRKSVEALSDSATVPSLSVAVRSISPPALQEHPVSIRVDEQGQPWGMSPQRRFFISRIVQEAVNNACKHARASSIAVRLRWKRFGLRVEVADDGVGFVVDAVASNGGFGLGAMRRLAQAVRARLQIRSQPSEGTQVILEVPRLWI